MKCLVLAQPYNSTVSTGTAERPQVAVGDFSITQFGHDHSSKNNWVLVNNENTIELFANDIKSLMHEIDLSEGISTIQSTSVAKTEEKDDSVRETQPKQDDKDIEQLTSPSQYESPQHGNVDSPPLTSPSMPTNVPSPQIFPKASSQQKKESDNAAAKKLSEILNKASSRSDKLTLYKDWLYFVDSGGQIQFQQMLQAFIPCASVLMLVISLAEELSSQSSSELQCADGKKYIVSKHSLSIHTLLKRLISMVNFGNQHQKVSSGDNHLSAAIKPPDKLKVITIATHRDTYDALKQKGEISESIEEKEARLAQIFQSVEGNLSYQNPVTGKILSEVDGRKAMQGVVGDRVIEEIRKELSKQAFEVDIPLTWYAYEIFLRDKARGSYGVLTLEECISSGIELGLEEGEAHSALKFFYLLNSLLYYPEEVNNLVFIDPHSLIQVVNELMVLVCKVRAEDDVGRGTRALPEMANFGIVSDDVFWHGEQFEMFAKIAEKFSDFKSHLFKIFAHLLIAKKLLSNKPPNNIYFMPALLPLIDPLEKVPFESSNSTPLIFYFKNGAPVGLFCAMIVNLLSSEDYITDDDDDGLYSDFSWSLDTKSTPKMYSNAIILRNYDLMGRVGLVESSDWFEIHCECCEDQAEVKEAIQNTIEETKKKRKIGKGMKVKLAFFCPCGKEPRHLAMLKQRYCELRCSLPGGVRVEDTKGSQHMSWIMSLKSNPGTF